VSKFHFDSENGIFALLKSLTMNNQLTFDITADELDIFLEDVNKCLGDMESGVLNLEQQADTETLNSIFRAAHTLKALAGTVGHRPMTELTHMLETIFDEMRDGRMMPTQAVADELLQAIDLLHTLRDEIITHQASGVEVAPYVDRLQVLQTASTVADSPELSLRYTLTPDQTTLCQEVESSGQTMLQIEIVVAPDAFAPAARLYQVAVALLETGQIMAQQPTLASLTEADNRMTLLLATELDIADIETLLSDIDDLASFQVEPCQDQAPSLMKESKPSTVKDSSFSMKESAESPKRAVEHHAESGDTSVRINIERLDKLMNLVGELVTDRTRLLQIEEMLQAQCGKGKGVGALSQLVAHFGQVVDQLQEEVMHARVLPIASLFNKFPRLVRDNARTLDKQANLIIEGESTELDRTIIQAISDPLIHLLRNAVGHGLETPSERQAVGKPPTGTIRLTAAPVKGQIVITVADDGRGIDPTLIRQAAFKGGLLTEEELAQLNNEEIIDLIFRPNLSTARQVTEMSGRGVGLDVVRTNIERLSGSVVVTSEVGQGTTFQLTLPLTLALVRTMLVTVCHTMYAIPLTSINGALYLAEAKFITVKGKPAIDWQNEVLPLLDLREVFDHARLPAKSVDGSKPSVVLVSWGKHRVGLVVDKIIGQQEIVVKSLSPLIGQVGGLSGATILGDGGIALIIDIAGLIHVALQARKR